MPMALEVGAQPWAYEASALIGDDGMVRIYRTTDL